MTAESAAQVKQESNKTKPVMLNERLHFNFGSETDRYEAGLEKKIRNKGGFQDLPSTPAEIFAAEEKAKREKELKKDIKKDSSTITP